MTEAHTTNPNLEVRPVLGRLMSGEGVIDRPSSHAAIEGEVLERALSYVDSRGRSFIVDEVYMGEIVGESTCVETTDEDEIVFATRLHRRGPTRFVLNREPVPTDMVTVILKRDDERSNMVLISAWTGNKAEPEPWDKEAGANSDDFWANHALIWGSASIDGEKPIVRG